MSQIMEVLVENSPCKNGRHNFAHDYIVSIPAQSLRTTFRGNTSTAVHKDQGAIMFIAAPASPHGSSVVGLELTDVYTPLILKRSQLHFTLPPIVVIDMTTEFPLARRRLKHEQRQWFRLPS